MGWPVAASHTRTVVSAPPEAIRCAVGAERHAPHAFCVPGHWLADRLAGGRVPQPHGGVGTAGDDPLAVGAERHAPHGLPCGRSSAGRWVGRLSMSHRRKVVSQLPETIRLPSGLYATPYTAAGVSMILCVCLNLTAAVNSSPSSAVDAMCWAASICLNARTSPPPCTPASMDSAVRRQPQGGGLAGTRVGLPSSVIGIAFGDGGPHEEQDGHRGDHERDG